MNQTLAIMRQYNIIGVVSGSMSVLRKWKEAAPGRIIGAVGATRPDSIRRWAADSTIRVLAELGFQYQGLAPTDSAPEMYFSLAEELDRCMSTSSDCTQQRRHVESVRVAHRACWVSERFGTYWQRS